jgi:ligand-binding sensor domain-containing protein
MKRPDYPIRCLLCFAFSAILFCGCKDELPPAALTGPKWVSFTHTSTPAILNNHINTLYVDGENSVWIGTDSGAVSYKNGWTTYIDSLYYDVTYTTGTRQEAGIKTIFESKDGAIWFGTALGGIRRYNRFVSTGKTWVRYSLNTDTDDDGIGDLSSNVINSIVSMKTGTPAYVYVSSFNGVDRFEPNAIHPELGTWSKIPESQLPFTNITASAINPATNMIAFAMRSHGIEYFKEPTNEWIPYGFPAGYDYPVLTMVFDPYNNTLWFGKEEGVTSYEFNYSRDSNYTNGNTGTHLPAGEVFAVAVESASSHWFGTQRGLVNLSGSTWTTYTHATTPELPGDIITALAVDGSGNIWIGTTAGIAVYNPRGTKL